MAAPDRTHYDVLGISRDADASAVRAAWKLHVQAWHPDRFGDELKDEAERQTARINEAYGVLRDSSRRAAYDCRLAADELAAQPGPAGSGRAARRGAPVRSVRAGGARAGSPVALAPQPASLGEHLSAIGGDAMRTVRRHPRLVAAIAATWLLVVGGGIVASAMSGPSVPASVEPRGGGASVVVDHAQAADLEQLAAQARAEAAAADAELLRMQQEDARLAAQEAAAAATAARADAQRAAQARRAGRSGAQAAQPKGRVLRVLPNVG